MTSGVRTRRATSTPELDASNLNNVERLIFAQAVHEFGSNAWQEVAKLLSKHPLISQPKGVFTPQSCTALYKHLMEDAGLECSETDIGPRSEKHLRLAQRYYVARVSELRELIASEEAKFRNLATEIDEIRSGSWDDKILAFVGLEPQKDQPPEEEAISEPEVADNTKPKEVTKDISMPAQVVEVLRDEATMGEEPIEEDSVPGGVVEPPPISEVEEKEEGSDNEAVNELIDDFGSDKHIIDVPEETSSVPEEQPPSAKPQEDEMQIEQAPVKQEQEEDEEVVAEPPREVPMEDVTVEAVEPEQETHETPPEVELEPSHPQRAEGKRKASDADTLVLDAQREKKRLREESEPAEEEEGVPKMRRRERTGESHAVSKRFQNMIGMLHSQISQHRYGNIFHNPIKKSEAPDYHDIVKRPIDLKTIKSRVKDGLISTSLEFQRDIFLMFANAMMYNRPGSEIYNMAEEMMLASEREINAFRQTEGFHRI